MTADDEWPAARPLAVGRLIKVSGARRVTVVDWMVDGNGPMYTTPVVVRTAAGRRRHVQAFSDDSDALNAVVATGLIEDDGGFLRTPSDAPVDGQLAAFEE